MNSFAVTLDQLRVVRGRRPVLHGLTVAIEAGTVTGLVGPSGCGKSTLMRSIVGVQVVAGGQVTVLGSAAGSPELRRRIGYSTQSPAVYPDLTVAENLRYFSSAIGASGDDVDRAIEAVGLVPQRDQHASRLSDGQRSRASLAVALLGHPDLLVLDEPTVGLDPLLRERLWALFHRLRAERGVTLLVSTHVMDEAARCQRLILMRDGDILAHDTPQGLCALTGTENVEQAFLRLVERREEEVGSRS